MSITPPGRPAHTFVYNNADRLIRYGPPLVTNATFPDMTYGYNEDGRLVVLQDVVK